MLLFEKQDAKWCSASEIISGPKIVMFPKHIKHVLVVVPKDAPRLVILQNSPIQQTRVITSMPP
jgi:hypothetical protein